jgi:putative ABC transport system permease protein
MLSNFLKMTLRVMLRHKFYSLINILGLAIGIAICLLILLFIKDEISYDRYHSKSDRIYRTLIDFKGHDGSLITPMNEYKFGDFVKTDFPELEVVRLYPQNAIVEFEDIEYQENQIFFAEENLFEVFDFELMQGDAATALVEPFTLVLSESTAQKYFGNEDPIGKILRFNAQAEAKVTGVIRDIPENSHFQADIFVSMITGKQVFSPMVLNNWGELSTYTYVLLPPGVDAGSVESRFPQFIEKNIGEGASENREITLQPMLDIHLHSHYYNEIEANSDIKYIYISSAICLFIILIACINYMNLATARSVKRTKEIGVRKTLGAQKQSLIGQFLSESVVLAGFSLLVAVGITALALPVFNGFVGKSLTLNPVYNWDIYLGLIGLTGLLGLLAGSYPSLYLSSIKAVQIFQERNLQDSSTAWLRKGLVVFQFAISIILIAATLVVFSQWDFLRNKDLGYKKDQLVLVPIPGSGNYSSLKTQLESNPNILSVGASNKQLTGALSSNLPFEAEGFERDEDSHQSIKLVTVDYDFLSTLGVEFAQGRDFSREFVNDQNESYILNEAAVRMIGWDDAIGKRFMTFDLINSDWSEREGRVVGVVEDFNMESLYNAVAPVVYFISDTWLNWMTIRLSGQHVPATIDFIRDAWLQYGSEPAFTYNFLDEQIDQLYRNEERFFQLFSAFTLLAIFIACLGIFGLSAFTAEQRTKEIGVRKVFGASVSSIITMLLREFTVLVGIGFLVAAPVAYWLMSGWLQDFTYRIPLGPVPFVLAGVLALVLAWITAGLQSAKAAFANPIRALRYE